MDNTNENQDEAQEIREEIADTILARARRRGFTVQQSDGDFPYQLVGPKVNVEGLAEQVAYLDGSVPEPTDNVRFAIPDVLGKHRADEDEWTHDAHMAAHRHAKHLNKAEGRIMKAKGLAETLRCALLSDRYDPEPFADDICAEIIHHISKAQELIDRHGSRHSNLFLAYFDRERPAGGAA
jgi:hypothetical protein